MRFWLVALVGCGRIDFELHSDGSLDSSSDSPSCLHTFCDDFERTSPVQGAWDSEMLLGGSLALDTGRLLASSPPVTGARAFLVKDMPSAAASVHVEADVSFDAGVNGEVDLVHISWTDHPGTCTTFGYFLVRDRLNVVEIQETYVGCGPTGNSNDVMPGFPPSSPSGTHHVAIDIAIGVKNVARLRASVDGTVDVDKAITAYDVPASRISITLGTPGIDQATAAWAVHYDNVVFDIN